MKHNRKTRMTEIHTYVSEQAKYLPYRTREITEDATKRITLLNRSIRGVPVEENTYTGRS